MKSKDMQQKKQAGLKSGDSSSNELYPPDVLRVERELVLLGFFTPKNKSNKQAREKVIRLTRPNADRSGPPLDVEIRIIAGGSYGLPTVADQDKYLALQSIIQRKLRAGEEINPVSFRSSEILRELGITKGGKTNEEVGEWMHRMFVTSIFKTVREHGGKRRDGEENLRPFKRRVAYGEYLETGARAVENYVWLDDWLLKSFLENRLINFDLQRYLRLKGTISKALAIHLHVWMYAARESGTFEKVYGDLCQLLGIENYARLGEGRLRQQLGPAFDELLRLDFLSRADIARAATARDFKIVLRPGKYLASATGALAGHTVHTPVGAGESKAQSEILALLPQVMKRGIPEPRARRILTMYATAEELSAQLALVDKMYRAQKAGIGNPVGYYIRALEEKWQAAPPAEDLTEQQGAALDVNRCTDCGGAGYFYPEGFEKGVKLCTHANLRRGDKGKP
jgi:hypothetical protein